MKKILLSILGVFVFLIFLSGVVFATPEDEARKHGVTFPIAELGNCLDFNSCRTFCEDPVNRETCISFAKKKGFHEEPSTRPDEILRTAKTELGCDSENSCKTFCEQEANHSKCFSFAQKYNLGGGQIQDPSKGEILNKAKEVLGCNSYESCRSFCGNLDNAQKCSDFAKQTGLRGGEQNVGPGGCTSDKTCKAFCSDPVNYQICSGFSSSTGGKFSGPGGCDSEASCRAYCQEHPQECGYGGPIASPRYDPIEMCSKTPNCSWTNNTCQCQSSGGGGGSNFGDYEKYCRENPDKCRPPGDQTINPQSSPYPTYSPPPGAGGSQEDFATQCTKIAGCTWTGTSCQCSTNSSPSSYSPAPAPTSTTTTQQSEGTSSYDPAAQCSSQPGCTWTGSTCQCQSVQGASTQKGFFRSLLELLLTI